MGYEELVIHIEPNGTARLAGGDGGDASWLASATAILDLPFARRRPSRVLELALDAPAEARPLLLAEYWHLLLTGTHHDPVYNLAVALDARGDALSNPPRLLAATLAAAARRVPPESRWRIDEVPDSPDPVVPALHALSCIPRGLDFVSGWALVRLQGLLADAALLAEARRLAESLSDRFGTRAQAVSGLAGDAAGPPPPERCPGRVRCWTLPCDFGSRRGQARVLIGRPAPGFHPLRFQAAWIREQRGGEIPADVMGRIRELSAAPELAR